VRSDSIHSPTLHDGDQRLVGAAATAATGPPPPRHPSLAALQRGENSASAAPIAQQLAAAGMGTVPNAGASVAGASVAGASVAGASVAGASVAGASAPADAQMLPGLAGLAPAPRPDVGAYLVRNAAGGGEPAFSDSLSSLTAVQCYERDLAQTLRVSCLVVRQASRSASSQMF